MDARKGWKTSLEWAEHAHFLSWLAGWLVTGIIAPVWAFLHGESWQRLLFLGALVLVCAGGLAFISSLLWWKFVGRKREQNASLAALETIAAAPADDPEEALPLQVAARLAYEAVEGAVLGMKANRLPNAPDGPLCFMAEKLFMADMPVYGKRFPSSKTMRIGPELLFDQRFKRDAAVVEDDSHRVTYTDLTAKRGEMTTAIEILKGAYKDR